MLIPPIQSPDVAIVKSEFIFESAPFASCHASTIVEATGGQLVAAWFGGTAESAADVVIYTSRYVAGKWTEPARTADGIVGNRSFACYNPVLFQPKTGPLLLFYKYGTGPQAWHGRLCTSRDQGKSWSAPHDLPEGIYGPIKNKPIELADGTILCPSSTEDHGWRVRFESTRDFGQTWSTTEFVNDGKEIGAIQPSILPLGGSNLRAIGRTQQGKLFATDSTDNGATWHPMQLLDVPNPNSGTDAIRLRDGRYLLVYNHSASARTPLNVAISIDAHAWKPILTLGNC